MVCERCGAVFCVDIENDAFWLSGVPARYCSKNCRKRAGAGSAEARRRMHRVQRRRLRWAEFCAGKGKTPYGSEKQAQRAADGLWFKKGWKLRAYECPGCRSWHLTSDVTGSGAPAPDSDERTSDAPVHTAPRAGA
jgi:hypothetical protein